MTGESDLIKHREIGFRGPHTDPQQAQSAMLLLSDVEGIVQVSLLTASKLCVSYDIRRHSFIEIESALGEMGFHIDQNLMYKLKRAVYAYTEATQRANLGLAPNTCTSNCAQTIFVQHYRKRAHGCRDERPHHWRRYL